MRNITLLVRIGTLAACLLWAAPAWAQVDPCPAPARQPPVGSPTLVNCVTLIAHPVNETMVAPETYYYYIRMPLTLPSQEQWAPFDEEAILTDFNSLWATNFLDDLWVEVIDEPFDNGVDAKHVVFHIEERNRVKAVEYVPVGVDGRMRVPVSRIDETLQERGIQVTLDTFVDEATVQQVVGVIRDLYAEQGYNDARVEPTLREVAGGPKLVDLRFNITDGPKVQIREIVFDGNEAFEDGKLRGQMEQNKQFGRLPFLPFITGGGAFREARFADDADLIGEFYRNNGYAGAQIGAPQTEILETTLDGKTRWIRLRVPVDEGQQFTVGNFEITGAEHLDQEGLYQFFDINEGEVFSLEKLRDGFEKVRELYGAFGFYQWTPEPQLHPRGIDPDTGEPIGPEQPPPIMDITLNMNEGQQFFVNRINFTGNTTTHDSVIRRELRLAEGAVFNSEALKESIRRLNQLGYFKPLEGQEGEMEVTPTPGEEDRVDVNIAVEEQNKNSIAFGAGVSQFEGVFGQLSFQTTNFLGRGETVGILLQKGSLARQYQLSFSEPYMFDRPITAGIDIHSRQFNFPGTFTQRSTGGSTVVGLPLADYTRLYLGYGYEDISVFDVNPAYLSPQTLFGNPYLAESLLLGQDGRRRVSKISPSVVFNTVSHPIFPTSGQRYTIGFDFAGIGGNTNYTQVDLEGIWYFGLAGPTSLGLRLQGRYIRPYGSTTALPIFEKIFLGGEYNIRGFDIRTVAPRDPNSGVVVGGNKSMVFNAEYYVDIGQLRVLAFFDAGVVKDVGEQLGRWEPINVRVGPPAPPLVNFDLVQSGLLLTEEGAFRTETIGRRSAIKTSTGVEARFIVPLLNIPFRLIGAYNPQRGGVFNHDGLLTPRFTFRFAVGTTF